MFPRQRIARLTANSGAVSRPLLLRMLARAAAEEAQDSRLPTYLTLGGAPAS